MSFDFTKRSGFHWGVNIDDVWKYAGLEVPRSIVVPHVFTVKTKDGPFTLPLAEGRSSDQLVDGGSMRNGSSSSTVAIMDDSRSGLGVKDSPGAVSSAKALALFLKEAGVGFVRCWFQWNFFERDDRTQPRSKPTRASDYLFPLDDFVASMNEAGIGIVAAIGNGYHRFLPRGLATDNIHGYIERLVQSSSKIVRHYSDKIRVWQIENEPNWWMAHYTTAWRKGGIWLDGKNQEPILGALYETVRSECPSSTILVNLQSDAKKTDWKMYSKYCDVLGLDFYPNYFHSSPIKTSTIAETARRVKSETGLPILVVETGYPTGPALLGFNESNQAEFVRSICTEVQHAEEIIGLGWWRFSDSYWKSFPFQENSFGLLTRDGRPKLGWKEYALRINGF